MGTEGPLTRVPGYWADRHPVAVSVGLAVTLAVLVWALAVMR